MSDDSSSSEDSLPLSSKKRPRIVSSTSESGDDSDVPIRRPKLNRQRLVNMLESSEDEEGSVNLRQSDESSDSSGSSDEEDNSNTIQNSSSHLLSSTSPKRSGNESDSSGGNSDKCPICLLSFSKQDIGTPENCEHLFCADCITEWSKNVNTCPVDRLTFNSIHVRQKMGGKVIKTIPVAPRRPSEEDYFIEDATYCEICNLSNSEETMLLCDSCDLGYHMHCLTPPLTEIPETEWFCPRCIRRNIHGSDEDDHMIRAINLTNSVTRIIDATIQTLNRINRVTRAADPAPSTSGSTSYRRSRTNRSGRSTQRNRTSNNTITRRRTRRRRARTRTVVVEYETRENGKFPIKVAKKRIKRRKRKQRTHRRAPRTAARLALVRSSVRGRLQEHKLQLSEATNTLDSLAAPRLSLYGNANELDYFEDSDIEDTEYGSGVGGMAVAVTSRSIASAILDSHRQVRRKMVSIPSPTYASTAPDILSSILESQTLLHSKKSLSSNTPNTIFNTKSQTELPNDIANNKKVNLKNEDANSNAKEVPGYPGAGAGTGRGGGGAGAWRTGQGGYQGGQDNRGNYSSVSNNYQSNRGQDGSYQGNRSFNSPWQEGNSGGPDNFQRREQFDFIDRSPIQRNPQNMNRGRGGQLRFNQTLSQRSQSITPWHNQNISDLSGAFSGPPPNPFSPLSMDVSSNPVDMTTNQENMGFNLGVRQAPYQDMNIYQSPQTMPPVISHSTPLPPPPQPPIIRFQRPPLSEDEGSDTSQPDEPDKYDPMEPTVDDSGSEEDPAPRPINIVHNKITIVSPPRKDHSLVAEYGSGSESPRDAVVMATDDRNFAEQTFEPHEPDVNDGCPNFSIYSSTIGIINNKQTESQNQVDDSIVEREEDLIQEDDYQCEENNGSSVVEDINSIPVPPEDKPDDIKEDELDDDWGDTNQQDEVHELETKGNDEKEDWSNKQVEEQLEEIFDVNSETHAGELSNELHEADPINNSEKELDSSDKQDTPVKDELNKQQDESRNVSDSLKTPQKRTITIKLLSNRGISQNVMNLYDKEDLLNQDTSGLDDKKTTSDSETSHTEAQSKAHSDNEEFNTSADEEVKKISAPDDLEKLTECISDVEDERSYTPCLDEKTKDNTLESEKDNLGIEGLDTEMISEDEANDIFSDHNNQRTDSDGGALELSVRDTELQPGEFEEGEIVEKHKQKVKERVKALLKQPNKDGNSDDERKKKKREKKTDKDGKDKSRNRAKKGNDDSGGFKKLSKSNKERNYRDRDDKAKNKGKDKRFSKSPEVDKENKKDKDNRAKEKKREKKKDIERYDVRTIISEKGRRVKDAFGRDTSRPRSKSPDSRVGSPLRFRRSLSRRRSSSIGRRSISRGRRSLSRLRRSPSRGRRSVSRRRRSISRGRRSLSRRRKSGSRARSIIRSGKSISPRRSISPKLKRSMSPRPRKIRSPRRRSISRGRSPIRRRSISPNIRRSKSPKLRRSISRGKIKRGKRSPSRGKRMSPRLRRDSPPRRRLSRRSRSRLRSLSKNRSLSPKARKPRKTKRLGSNSSKRKKSKSPHKIKQKRRRSRSFSPGVVLSRSPTPNRVNVQEQWTGEKSPLYREWSSGSQSMSPVRASPGWTPPPQRHKSPQPDNLRVILTTKDKSKKKERKKKVNKRLKANERILQQQKDTGPCKEVFTSGNNILVSVSFNKNQENQDVSEMPPPSGAPKKKKHKTDNAVKSKKDKNKDKSKKRRGDKNKKSKDDENKKPVAIIDLDKSPFKELTPSPKAVIVLSDSENGEKEEELMERQEMIREELLEMGFPQCDDVESPQRSPVRENVYVPPAGPKTPPEPAVKFTIATKTNPQLRAVNPLHEDEEEMPPENIEEKQEADKRTTEVAHKGPNTPPEPPNSPPSSPDVYDPFEPTRSGSATPERPSTPQLEKRSEDLLQVPSMSLEAAQKSNLSADDVIQARPISPMEKVLALLKSTRNNLSPANTVQPLYPEQIFDNTRNTETENQQVVQPTPVVTVQSPEKLAVVATATKAQVVSALVKPNSPKLIYSTVAPTVVTSTAGFLNPVLPRIPIYNTGTPPNPRIILPSPTKSSPLKMPSNKLFVGKPSPIKSTPIKPMPSKTIISKLPMPAIKPLPPRPGLKDKSKNGQNGNDVIDLDLDMDSPYSPGSSDFGDLFDPPADNGKHNTNTYTPNKSNNVFDSLFPGKSSTKLAPKSSHTKVTVKQTKKSKGTKVGVRIDDDSLRILDELPNSAVELQVKTKFLKKLNRQERVVEEVKLVLKPHYSKKHITKEDYKEILRRAVPKICHNRSGEINPAKIHALIEAYVKKFRKKALMVK